MDILMVAFTIIVDKLHHVEPPDAGAVNMSAAIGWLGVVGALFIFGSYGIMIKTPAVQEAKCDSMVFQCYNSSAVAAVCLVIWVLAGSAEGMTFTSSSFSMGVLFGTLWIVTQILAYQAVQGVGFAVASAIWRGITIVVSFGWGVAVFHNPVHDWPRAMLALVLMVAGVGLATVSGVVSDMGKRAVAPLLSADSEQSSNQEEPSSDVNSDKAKLFAGIVYAIVLGFVNGSLMAPVTCFHDGCESIGVQAYTGTTLAPLAFLPSLAAGILVAHPILFLLYWGPSMCRGEMPQFHVSTVATPALMTGAFWGMGNFVVMFATVYLGQTVGFPLTQCCLVVSGAWGILYFKEIQGTAAISIFVAAAVAILVGATLNSLSA